MRNILKKEPKNLSQEEKLKKDKKSREKLTQRVLLGLILGAITGVLLHDFVPEGVLRDRVLIGGVFYLFGQGFMRLLQMLVVPLVFFSLSMGAQSMGDSTAIGKVGIKTLCFYMATTAIAVALAIGLSTLIQPGAGMELTATGAAEGVELSEVPSLMDTILNMIPKNPIEALAKGEMLQIILFALLVGFICAKLSDRLQTLSRILNDGNDLMMEMTSIVMKLAPIGVFSLIARTFADLGLESLLPMLSYFLTVLGALIGQILVVYIPLVLLFAQLNPLPFLKKMIPAQTFAFSAASSNATIPLTLSALDQMGCSRRISSFTIPLGATINMDGTAIMQGCAVVFVANAYGIPLSVTDFLMVILTATLASVGTAGVPGVGLVTLSMVFASVNLPVEGIAMIMGIDRLLDMARTAVNITGDAAVTLICAKQGGAATFDKNRYLSTVSEEESDEF